MSSFRISHRPVSDLQKEKKGFLMIFRIPRDIGRQFNSFSKWAESLHAPRLNSSILCEVHWRRPGPGRGGMLDGHNTSTAPGTGNRAGLAASLLDCTFCVG